MTTTTGPAYIAEGLWPLVVRIDTVRGMRGNPRKGDVQAVMRSFAAFGMRKPIVAMADGTITAGHHMHAAAVQLGWEYVAVVFCDDDDTTAKAFALADNRSADLGRYDTPALAEMLAEVAGSDYDLLLATSYTQDDLDALLALTAGPPPKGDDLGPEDDGPDLDPRSADSGIVCPECGYHFGND